MAINRVPKFVEHRIAKRRREGPSAPRQDKKFSAFDAARKKYEEKLTEKQLAEQRKTEKEAALVEKKKEREQVGKLIKKRNQNGQPDMNAQLELLMKRFPYKA
jgi:hypothetical protein